MASDRMVGRVTTIAGKRYMWLYNEQGNVKLGFLDDKGDSDEPESEDG